MTIFGWDMSVWDNPSIGNAIGEGISFITHKAGGDNSGDPELAVWWNAVKGIPDPYWDSSSQSWKGLLKGFYWVQLPGNPSGRADAFLAHLDAVCSGWRGRPMLLFADCEEWNNDPATVPSVGEVNAFCDRLVQKTDGVNPFGYLPPWVYGSKAIAFRYPLIASSYVNGSGSFKSLYPGDNDWRWSPYGGKQATILQYSAKAVIGGQSTSDADAFRGDLGELTTLVAPGWSGNVNVDDLIANSSKDAIPETPLGHYALSQGVPDGTLHGQRVAAWQAIQNLGTAVTKLQASIDALAARPAVTVSEADLAAAFVDALKQLATPKTP